MKTVFDESAKWYSEFYSSRNSKSSARKIVEVLKPTANATIVDLGCGTGEITNSVMSLGYKTLGIDPSKNMVNSAMESFSNIKSRWIVGDLRTLDDDSIEYGYAYFHVANYIIYQDSLSEFIEVLSKKMRIDSRFAFDYWRKEQVLTKGLEPRKKNFDIDGIEHCREVTPKIFSMEHIEIRIDVFSLAENSGVKTSEVHELAVFDESTLLELADNNGLVARITNWENTKDNSNWDSVCILEKKHNY